MHIFIAGSYFHPGSYSIVVS